MFEKYFVYFVFSTVALIGVAVPFIVAITLKSVRREAEQTNARLDEILVKIQAQAQDHEPVAPFDLSEIKAIVSQPLEKLDEIEKRTRRLTERLEQIEQRDHTQRQYDQAIKLIKMGVAIEEIMVRCGLNRGEVELIAVMHENDQNYKSASS